MFEKLEGKNVHTLWSVDMWNKTIVVSKKVISSSRDIILSFFFLQFVEFTLYSPWKKQSYSYLILPCWGLSPIRFYVNQFNIIQSGFSKIKYIYVVTFVTSSVFLLCCHCNDSQSFSCLVFSPFLHEIKWGI